MENAIIFVSIGFSISIVILSIALSYKLVVESNLKKKILAQETENEVTKTTITDDLQRRMEIFRRERFAPVNSQHTINILRKNLRKEIPAEEKNVP